ncbi:hypothetical protein BJ875DRAFT_268692 [Amylocarpus encephaloides]|uniref:BZIP domain-containing protein n=1 Tax=Amylocarpus encephaloides TaxID=45428 RepID=A0A9P7YM21_9HELO|nr:hypothetical protein BJ875DRAFT_268692 [Amylocarpus encephaloides]
MLKSIYSQSAKSLTASKEKDEDRATALSVKQHRRAQVRKAQIEHRQRKANYVKHLEQDIIDLREMISSVEKEATTTQQENEAIRNAMLSANIKIPLSSVLPITEQSQIRHPERIPPAIPPFQSPPNLTIQTQPQRESQGVEMDISWLTEAAGSSTVSTIFDELLSQTVLQVSPTSSQRQPSPQANQSPGGFSNTSPISSAGLAGQRSTRLSPPPRAPRIEEVDLSTLAINFILALEHPCRTHFHPPASEFDPLGDPSGHELLASTTLYSSAPLKVFPTLSAAVPVPTWTHPSSSAVTLANLEEMAKSLPKENWEITPVQAWFLLAGRYGVEYLVRLGKLEGIRRELSTLVGCFAYGAVMDEARFWDVVAREVGEGVANLPNQEEQNWI